MADVLVHFLDEINTFLGKVAYGPKDAEMIRDFEDLAEEALRAAARKVCEEIRGRSAPSVKTLKKHLVGTRHKAEVYTAARVGPNPWDFEDIQRLHYARRKQAAFMCRCNLGRRADKEGWLCAMLDFAEDNGRIPEGKEIDACIVKAKRNEQALYEARGEAFHSNLVMLRQNMLDRASLDVFGEEAIKRIEDRAVLKGQQGRRAGSAEAERIAANNRLREIEDDYEPLSASPLLKKALGLPLRGRADKRFDQGVDRSE